MKFDLQIRGLDKVRQQLARLSGSQFRDAAAQAVNDTAFTVRKAMQDEMRAVFDRPTPHLLSSVQFQRATTESPRTDIKPTYQGGKGIDPQKYLIAQVDGGTRADKRSEAALRRVGLLPAGYQAVIPKEPYPGSDDGRGNLKGSFIVTLISYFQAFGEQGYRANATERSRAKRAKIGRTDKGYKTIGGVVFFVSLSRLRGGPGGRHLEPGIYAKTGIHGANIRPVMLFTRRGSYTARLSMERVAEKAQVQQRFESRLRFRIRQGLGE